MDRRILLAGLLGFGGVAFADEALTRNHLKDQLAKALGHGGLSDKDAQDGLRQALGQGTTFAVGKVSKLDGYWGDKTIQIPLPKPMAATQKLFKPLGQSGLLDDVHLRMNRAAEAAAPVAGGLFMDAIKGMSIKDAAGIVKGGPTSGTQYLQKTCAPRLTTAFTPPMESALQSTGAVEYLDRAVRRNNLQGYVKGDAKTYLGQYAVGLALAGLFHYVGVEEAAIRRDPAERTTSLLKSVFG